MPSGKYKDEFAELLTFRGVFNGDFFFIYEIRGYSIRILQNRVAPAEKLHALIVAEAVVGIVGKEWFFGPMNLPGV